MGRIEAIERGLTELSPLASVENPALAAGRNEIHWKALSKDGHVISGKLTYTIKPAIAGS